MKRKNKQIEINQYKGKNRAISPCLKSEKSVILPHFGCSTQFKESGEVRESQNLCKTDR